MKTVIGTVQGLEGRFFAKDADGNVIELENGDSITEDMVVYGDKSNPSSASIEIAMVGSDEVISIAGASEQLFDSSLVDGPSLEEGLAKDSVENVLDPSIYADAKTDETKVDDAAAGDETAAGTETPGGQSSTGVFDARDAAQVDINSDLRDAPFGATGGVLQPDGNIQLVPESPKAKNDTNVATEDGHEFISSEDSSDTINGRNDGLSASGNILANDITNNGLALVTNITVDGTSYTLGATNSSITTTYGILIINNTGAYTFNITETNPIVNALNVGDTLPINIGYTISDGVNPSDSATLTINIEGRDDAPVIDSITVNSRVNTVLFSEGFEGINMGTGDTHQNADGSTWYIDHGTNGNEILTSTSGNSWDMNASGIEMRIDGGVHGLHTADGSGNYIEMDAHTIGTNSSITTNINLGLLNDTYNLTFNFMPRPGKLDTSDMQFSLDGKVVNINVDASGNITFTAATGVSVEITPVGNEGWFNVNTIFTGITASSADLDFRSTGVADTFGAYMDNIKLTGTDSTIIMNANLSDVDNTNLESATVILTNYRSGDAIGFSNLPAGITGYSTTNTDTNGDGTNDLVLHLTGTSTVADYETALESLTFNSSSTDGSQRDFEFTVFDGTKHSDTTNVQIDISTTNLDHSSSTAGEVINGFSGDDIINGGSGADTIHAGAGNDTIVFDANDVVIDGGDGIDTLILETGINLDFSDNHIAQIINNIEKIDLTANGDHAITNLTLDDVLHITSDDGSGNFNLTILGDNGDSLNLQDTNINGQQNTWSTSSNTNDGFADIYVNSGDNSVSITVDEHIHIM